MADNDAERFFGHPAQYETTPAAWHKKENRRLKIVVAVETAVIVIGVALFFLVVVSMAGASLAPPTRGIRKEVVRPGNPSVRVAVIPVSGVIYSGSPGMSSGGTADWIVHALQRVADDPSVVAVVLDVTSPGGTISASDKIHRAVEDLRGSGRKVVAFFDELAASGGYYVSAPADTIIASPTAITGSIGVILQFINVRDLFGKVGLEAVTIKSAAFKDIGSPFRDMSEEERGILQALANEAHERFVSVVAGGRKGLTADEVRGLADGRIFTAAQAAGVGLVDSLGYFEDAVKAAEDIAGVSGATVVRYGAMPSLVELLTMQAKHPDPASELARLLAGAGPSYLLRNLPAGGYVWPHGVAPGE